MSDKPFPNVPVPARPDKPRDVGLTVLIDWGMGPAEQADRMEACGAYVDAAKIAVGISGLLSVETLSKKIKGYGESDVRTFPGGQYLEYAVSLDKQEDFLQDAKDAGYQLIEVSDNTVPFEASFKTDLIKLARDQYGLEVFAEVGSKIEMSDTDALVEDVQRCIDAGAWKVFIEAADLFDDGLRTDLIDAAESSLPMDKLVFELPGWWLGPLGDERASMAQALLKRFGPEVNLANVAPEEALFVETLRRKTGTMGFQ